ncbi:replication factor C small subunit [archaeon]|nr:replication factor C small subunit [archaeon]MBT4351383.1 replication factor C small subunit [archaeon]MBT4646868.1 replication factor C small subunit [archaeon]MBT6822113.1 replication factor C small subunit [archaeon]MBT7392602.1 replication factor C small subunit [archaeon]
MQSIWTEKYRPQKFSEIKGQKNIVSRVKAFVEKKNMPHILFAGPAGVGKSTLALVIAKELFGDTWGTNFLELNASDERGIDIVRVKVKDFARTKAIGNVPFKILFLDECDALTREAQQALRRTMENYTRTARFILSCNYSSKILDPIQSRCAIFKFKPLSKEDIFELIDELSKKESFTISNEAKTAIFEISRGDCRKVENILQASISISNNIDEKAIYSISSHALPKEVNEILKFAVEGKFLESRKKLLNSMLENGLSGLDIIRQIQKEIWNLDTSDKNKLEMTKLCGEIEFRLVEGSDEFIQLEALLSGISLVNQ